MTLGYYEREGRLCHNTSEAYGMATFGFWNVDSLRNLAADQRELARYAADLALERGLDALFLIECAIPPQSLVAAFTDGPTYYPLSCGERFKVLASVVSQ